jgi:uncharacterized membrane protein
VLFFGDAIPAIAITLLVVDIRPRDRYGVPGRPGGTMEPGEEKT